MPERAELNAPAPWKPGSSLLRFPKAFNRGRIALLALLAILALYSGTVGRARAAGTSVASSFRFEGCGSEFTEYADLHGKTRGTPDAKYLVYSCTSRGCGGLGERMRGALLVLRLAMATQRVMLVDWTYPLPLVNYLKPNKVNWTLDGLPNVGPESKGVVELLWLIASNNSDGSSAPWNLPDFEQSISKSRVVRIRTDEPPDSLQRTVKALPPSGSQRMAYCSCMFNMMFAATELLNKGVQLELTDMYGDAPFKPYVAVHLELFASMGDRHGGRRDMEVLTAALDYAITLSGTQKIAVNTTPVAFVTDSRWLRWYILRGYLRSSVSPRSRNAMHGDAEHVDRHASEFIEAAILARASCILHSGSAYSDLAIWWGNAACHTKMIQALDETAKKVTAHS